MHRSLIANFLGRKATLFIAGLSLVGVASTADARPKKPRKPVATAKAPAAKAAPVITAENKAALLALMGDYKFAMTQAEVTVVVKQQIDARYVEKFEETTDVMKQDRLRKDKKEELKRFTDSSIEFDDKKGGWDVSLIEHEFGHNSGESMMVNWENDNGKNQRRFFFFHESHLYKMFISLDVSKLPDDKKDFGTFEATMEGAFGRGAVDAGKIVWAPADGSIEVTALDMLRSYDALCLVVTDPKVNKKVIQIRAAHAPAAAQTSTVIKAVIANEGDASPDINANSDAVNAVLGPAKTTPITAPPKTTPAPRKGK